MQSSEIDVSDFFLLFYKAFPTCHSEKRTIQCTMMTYQIFSLDALKARPACHSEERGVFVKSRDAF